MTAPQELAHRPASCFAPSSAKISPPLCVSPEQNEIAATTLNIPHPYAEHDARSFLAKADEDFRAGRSVYFAISILPGRELCGAVGLRHCGGA